MTGLVDGSDLCSCCGWIRKPGCPALDQVKKQSARAQTQTVIVNEIKRIHSLPRLADYGSPRMHQELKQLGLACSKNTVARLMKIHGIRARSARKFHASTTDSKHDLPIAKNVLNREFKVQNLNQVWLTDFTYIPLKEGFSYLCTIMDLCSRKIIGWATSQNIDTQLALDALHQAVTFRAPKPGLILHSDRGSQYASRAFREQLKKCKI